MSKSLGNFFTVREIGEKYDLQVLRFFMLSAHYRSPLNFSAEIMESSRNALERILTAADRLRELEQSAAEESLLEQEKEKRQEMKSFREKFQEAMDDDLNTADAISAVFELVKFANTEAVPEGSREFAGILRKELEELCGILGLKTERKAEVLDEEIEEMIRQRQEARKARDFARADAIRNELLEKGILLEDTREGVKWKRA